MQTTDIELISFHDSVVSSVGVFSDARVEVTFSHLEIYAKEAQERYGVWSYTGTLHLVGAQLLDLRVPTFVEGDSLEDGSLASDHGERTLLEALRGLADVRVTLAWMLSGAKFDVRARRVELKLLTKGERFDTFSGPLFG